MIIRPYVIEVLGTPEAGKTTVIKDLILSLSKKEYIVQYVRESAEITPKQLSNGSVEAQIWMKLHTAQEIFLATKSNVDIVLVDRGIIDTLFWDYLYFKKGELSHTQLDANIKFFQELNFLPNLAIILTTTAEEAIARRGGEGRIVTRKFIEDYNSSLLDFCKNISVSNVIYDTTNKEPKDVLLYIEHLIEQRCCI